LPGATGGEDGDVGVTLKVAVTVVAALTVTTQVPVPEHGALQPAKVDPVTGVAVRVTAVPDVTDSVHVAPQLIPAGELVTVPEPEPALASDSVAVVAPVPDPVTEREMVSPPAVTFTFPAKVPALVGRKRTVTVWLAPAASENEPPDTMLYGAPMLAVPERLAGLVFCTVKVRSAELPSATLPNVVVLAGVTLKSGCATPLAAAEHALSLPAVSTAVTRAKYVVPATSAVTRLDSVCPPAGVEVGEATVKNELLGHEGEEVPR